MRSKRDNWLTASLSSPGLFAHFLVLQKLGPRREDPAKKNRSRILKKYSLILMMLVIGILEYSCEPKGEVTIEREPVKITGPKTEEIDEAGYAKIYYVADNVGSDETGDGSKEKPWASINYSLSKISNASAESRIAVLVSEGDYSKSTIRLKEYIDLYGGFSEKEWERDIAKNVSVLSGDGKRRIVVSADNTKLDGFMLMGGVIRGKGAAILCNGVSPQISNNTFYRNKTLKPIPWNPKFIHETAHDGGAIYCENGTNPLIKNNLFVNNQTENGRGAAIAFNNRCTGQIIDNVFIKNVAGTDDPMRSSDGGAVSVFDWCRTIIKGNIILGNRAESKNDGGGIFLALWSSAEINNNMFVDNWSGDDAGALFVGGQEHRYDSPLDHLPSEEEFYVTIRENTFLGNSHGGNNSGAMRFTMESRGEFVNNVVAHSNGIYFQRSDVKIIGNTILENFLFKETKEGLNPGHISENIIWGDFIITTEANVTNNNIKDGFGGADNFSEPPVFDDDGIEFVAEGVSYHTLRFYTSVYLSDHQLDPGSLIGRVVYANGKWGVVRSNNTHNITLWGDFSREIRFSILPTYRLLK